MKKRVEALKPLTPAEFRIMNAVWALGTGSVAEIASQIEDRRLAYNTVLTTLRVLEKKGYVRHEESGRTFIFSPVVAREAAQTGILRHVKEAFFAGSADALMMHLARSEELDERDVRKVLQMLAEAEK